MNRCLPGQDGPEPGSGDKPRISPAKRTKMTATTAVNVVVKASGHLVYEERPRNRSEVVGQVLSNTPDVFHESS